MVVASNGLEAIVRLEDAATRDIAFDAVLMDLEMPSQSCAAPLPLSPYSTHSGKWSPADVRTVMDGLTALRRIRELESEGSLNRQMIIALTGNAREEQISQARALGMDDGVCIP